MLSVAIACLSATLATKFMFSIGQDMGSPILMAALGLLLDLAKRQQAAKQIIKSQHTLSQIPILLTNIDELSNQQATFSGGESVVSKYGAVSCSNLS
ncbi:hypothetical protein GLP23_16665 [Photobacterium carnosum]|nr:hypothetical protein [Photobacterium carnosum]